MEVNSFIQSATGGRRPRRAAWMLIPALVALAAFVGAGGVPTAEAQAFGTVTVQKALVGPNNQMVTGDLSGYVFTLSGGGSTITMPATNAQGQASIGVAPGTYSITEQQRPGSTLVGFQIGGQAVGNFAVTGGQTVNITATNQVAGTSGITIAKSVVDAQGIAVPNADRSGFQFAISGPSGFAVTLTTDANGAAATGNLAAGTYTVTETPRSGFVLASLTINGVPVNNGASFTLAAGQTANIAAANRAGTGGGTVTISKQIVDQSGQPASGDRSGFQITVACATGSTQFTQTVTTDANGAATVSNVPAGNCTVSEASRQGFTLVSIFVGTATTDIGNGGAFQVTAGQTTTLTIRNRSGGGTGATEQIQLFSGCNNVTVTWPSGTPTGTVAQNIQPAGILIAIWRFDNAAQRFVGFSPIPNAPNDLVTVDRAQPVFICTNGGGSLTRPTI
jgi:hypothetical protein